MDPTGDSTIADEVSRCLEPFKRICHSLNSTEPPLSAEDDSHHDLSSEAVTDSLSRFNVWIGNIGALQRGRSSLDYRLGHADVRLEVLRLLKQLLFSLSELWDIVSGAREQQVWYSTDALLPVEGFSDEDTSDDEGTLGEDDGEGDTTSNTVSERMTESNQLYLSIVEAITSLFKLSMFIRKSTRGNKFAKSSAEKKYDTHSDVLHVRDRFPFASNNLALIERLGKANAQRRQWLLYKKRHREKLAIAPDPPAGGPGGPPWNFESLVHQQDRDDDDVSSSAPSRGLRSSTTGLSSTVASTFYGPSLVEPNIEGSEMEFSETSYSVSGFGDSGETILVPQPPPESADENPFECPYCFTILTIVNKISWTKHVHSDLASYVCTQENCSHPLFESRHQWFNHELEVHRQEWACSICAKVFTSEQEFEQHMKQQHSGAFLVGQLSAITARAARPVQRILASACPLCDYDAVLRRRLNASGSDLSASEPITVKTQSFRSHLGRHLEQLALFVLPRNEVTEMHDDNAHSIAANDSDEVPLEKVAGSDDSEAEGIRRRPTFNTSPGGWTPVVGEATAYPEVGLEGHAVEERGSELDEILEEMTGAPELAMGWLPPMNFTPPEKYFETDDIDRIPRREECMFGGDLFTPGWVRGYGKDKEGFCGRCEPGVWHRIDDSSYETDLTYKHGISSSGIPLARPSSIKQIEGKPGAWEGYCDACRGWRVLRATKMGWNWFRHCVREHHAVNTETCASPHQKATAGHVAKPHDPDIGSLIDHIRMSDFSKCTSLLEEDPMLALGLDSCSRTPLHYAAEVGDVRVVQLLLAKHTSMRGPGETRAFINRKSSTGETALMLAVSQGHEEITGVLITSGAYINAITCDGKTALDHAAEAGYVRIAGLLAKSTTNVRKSSYYRIQMKLRDRRMAEARAKVALGPHGVEKIVPKTLNWTPLMAAAMEGDVRTVKLLLENGVDIEAPLEDGETALMLGALKGHHEVIRILLSSGANIDATTAKGWTTLMLVVRDGDEKTVNFLLSCGADVNHLSPDRWSALAEATSQGHVPIMRLLLQCGADTESKSSHDWTPLMHAAYRGDEAAVGILLEAGADMDILSLHDETAVLLAAAGSHTGIVRTLLNAGCAPEPAWASSTKSIIKEESSLSAGETKVGKGGPDDRTISLGWTPLMLACQNGLEDVARMLLKANVNLEPQSPYRKTALDIARENGRLEIVKILEGHTAQTTAETG
ncbi:hypothetical protein GP486_004295 [Trichoglossum hirsutum]|uniref:C2H2-type domain-containing protein n=1 Tax=Trichoglossum hirsutum TaxID=265104 RepID=A0A9P8LB41_9PEZI|nr:hypothetical protein GP486_004295 [Trichoglossum hirsutum]